MGPSKKEAEQGAAKLALNNVWFWNIITRSKNLIKNKLLAENS
jgi:hypothetical protein